MSSLSDKILAEKQQMDKTLALVSVKLKSKQFDVYEIIAIAAMMSNIYHGAENILKQICQSKKINIESTDRWHRHLLVAAETHHIVSEYTADQLMVFLQFRHFFVHAYSSDLMADRVIELGRLLNETFVRFFDDISGYIEIE